MYTLHIHICLLLQGSISIKKALDRLDSILAKVVNPDIVQLGFRKGDAVDAERARKWMSLERQGALTPDVPFLPLVYFACLDLPVFTLFIFFILLFC